MIDVTVGVLGGTGPQGKGLALRWAKAGISVIIGSRKTERAEATAPVLLRRVHAPEPGPARLQLQAFDLGLRDLTCILLQ